jgi:copper homeostasis protein
LPDILLEVCIDSIDGLAAAVQGGAGRIELCSALEIGGLTPSLGLMRAAADCGVPVFAMIRPRAGDFCFSPAEVAVMRADIAAARAAGMAGVVLGASLSDGRLDEGTLWSLISEAGGMGLTLHRAFDLTPVKAAALETALALGFHRILTSGGAATAAEGVPLLATLMQQAGARITIMPGAGISAQTLPALASLPLREVHASCSIPVAEAAQIAALGFGPALARRTSADRVRALRLALDSV